MLPKHKIINLDGNARALAASPEASRRHVQGVSRAGNNGKVRQEVVVIKDEPVNPENDGLGSVPRKRRRFISVATTATLTTAVGPRNRT